MITITRFFYVLFTYILNTLYHSLSVSITVSSIPAFNYVLVTCHSLTMNSGHIQADNLLVVKRCGVKKDANEKNGSANNGIFNGHYKQYSKICISICLNMEIRDLYADNSMQNRRLTQKNRCTICESKIGSRLSNNFISIHNFCAKSFFDIITTVFQTFLDP